mgnify:CR=1 FL=1
MGIVRLLIRVVTFWNNILAESSKSPAKQLFGVEMRSEADYEYLLMMKKPAYAGFFMSVFRNYLDTKNHSGIIKPSQKTD